MIAEIETPVSEIVSDNRTADEKALTSHLQNVEIPSDPDEVEAAESSKASDEAGSMPGSLEDALALLAERVNWEPEEKFHFKVKTAKLEKLRALVHELSQSAPAPAINAIEFLKRTPDAAALARIAESYPKPPKSKKA